MKYILLLVLVLSYSLASFAQTPGSCNSVAIRRVSEHLGGGLGRQGIDFIVVVGISHKIYNAAIGQDMLVETVRISVNNKSSPFRSGIAYPTYEVTTTLTNGECKASPRVKGPYDFYPSI